MELEKPLTFGLDKTSSAQYIYFGEADPGAQEDKEIWRLQRYDRNTGRWLFALGNSGFVHKYSDRLSLEYQ